MKRAIFTIAAVIMTFIAATAQDKAPALEKKRFSPEEFQAKQRAYITEKAGLTAEEAEAFFPLFFELQKKKFEIEHGARKSIKIARGEKMSEEQCREFAYKMADAKIEVAKLERKYTDKYLKVLSACKLQRVLHAESSFQRDLMKKMMQHHEERKGPKKH